MKFIYSLFIFVFCVYSQMSYASRYLPYLFVENGYLSTEELINRIEKYDTNKVIHYEKTPNGRYVFDDYYVSSDIGGPVGLRYYFLNHKVLSDELKRRESEFVYASYYRGNINIPMFDFDQDRAVMVLSIAFDDREKAQQIFYEVLDKYVEQYQENHNCESYCKIFVNKNYGDKRIVLVGGVSNEGGGLRGNLG